MGVKMHPKNVAINKELHKYRDLEEILKPFNLVYRDEWDDEQQLETSGADLVKVSTEVSTVVIPPLKHPISAVLFSYTQTPMCGLFDECQRFLKAMTKESLKKGMPDIPYSFAIGGDGTVYELRGWTKKPEMSEKYPQLDGAVIEIAHFGQQGSPPPLTMANAAWELVQYGVKIAFMKNKPRFYTDYHD
ncbi:peptidoglycan-recognition protein LF-like [Macrosteles quadrilineatus]|uniref:peptidoglycan-recognition protein LF-like n=1 Tax=Macrosteles quadrilineatus TaxID=74068 RepID=UPI0023E2DD93|nr:peptidoglycan-recognition protein LF-like [Macrosteles quadrilineatus]